MAVGLGVRSFPTGININQASARLVVGHPCKTWFDGRSALRSNN